MISAATQPQFKEGLKYIKSLYDMGAFYEGNFSNTEDGLRSLINQDGEPVLFFPHLYSAKYIDSPLEAHRRNLYPNYIPSQLLERLLFL